MRTALVYFVSTAIASGIPFLLSIVLARYLSVPDAGLIALYTTQVALSGILVGFGAYASVQARFFIDPARFPSYLSASVALHLVLLVIGVGLTLTFLDKATTWATLPAWALLVALGVAFLQALLNIHLLLSQAKGWAGRYLALQAAQAVLLAVLAPLLTIGLSLGWRGFAYAQLAQMLIMAPFNIRALTRSFGLRLRFDGADLWANLRFGLGLLPHTLAGFVVVGYDRIYVGAHAGAGPTGIYSVMLQIGMLVSMVMTAVNKVYTPWMYARLKNPEEWVLIGRATWMGIGGIWLLCLAFAPAAYFAIGPVLGAKYLEGQSLVGWVVLGGALNGTYLLMANLVFYSERMLLLSMVTISGALTKWFCLPLLYQEFGLEGAAMSNAAGLFVCMLMTMVCVTYLYDRRVLFGRAFSKPASHERA